MAKNKKTPRQAMKYWGVGWPYTVVIKARTARVAVRKWLRDNATYNLLIRDYELDNPGGTGDMPHETAATAGWGNMATASARKISVADVPVEEVPKGTRNSSAPEKGAFWSGINRDRRR